METIELDNFGTDTYNSGWTCDRCGQWVSNDTHHCCGYHPQYYTIDRQQEIVDLLREILAVLKEGK